MNKHYKTNNWNYLIDATFNKVNRLFVNRSIKNENDRTSLSKYCTSIAEIKYFKVLTDRKSFFDVPISNKEEAYEKIIEISKNNNYTTENLLLDYEYFSKHFKLIAIDLSKQIDLKNVDLKQQINFISKLQEDEATMLFITEKSEETNFEFSPNFVSIV